MLSPRASYSSRGAFRRAIIGKPAAFALVQSRPDELRGPGRYPLAGPRGDSRKWYCFVTIDAAGIVTGTDVPGLPRWWPW